MRRSMPCLDTPLKLHRGLLAVISGWFGFALLLLLFPTTNAHAATWRVEKDGSGDFEILQDAIDAAAPGDSILIGPGRFDTFRRVVLQNGIAISAIAAVQIPDLTLIGAGRDETIIGPTTPILNADGLATFGLYIDQHAARAHVRDVGVENTFGNVSLIARATLERCRVVNAPTGASFAIFVIAFDVQIRDCEVFGRGGIITGGQGTGTRNLLVEDCTFEDPTLNGVGVEIGNGAQNCMVRRCTFRGGAGGVQFSLGGTGWVEDCTFEGVRVIGISLSSGSAVVRRCHIGVTRMGLSAGQGRLEVYDTLIEGGTQATIFSATTIVIRNSHILNAGGPTVIGQRAAGEILDLRENWWGTSDESLIESWIDDPYGTVLWRPILTDAVSSERTSIGEFKARFGAGQE